ncbi:mitofilin family membrane protein [Hyphomonas sp.]|uniref:COG4223 family protein n=1 Tax=Hyphomonas sp. TaxID=87 RepID=UPI003F72B4EB
MTNDPEDDMPVSSAEPIDADFEPAFEDDEDVRARGTNGSGPGWLGLGVAALVAAGIGGAIGIIATLAIPDRGGDEDISAVTAELESLKAELQAADLERSKVIRDAAELESRLAAGLNSTPARAEQDLGPLLAELDAVSRRLDEALAANSGEVLVQLTARLDALEAVDTSGEATAAELARALGAVSERVTSLETRLADLQSDMVRSSGDTTELTSLIERMRSDEAAVRAKAEASESSADAALALSAIEAASRRGSDFESDYRKLRAIMPRSAAVRALGEVASTGAPTLAQLQQSFGPASTRARAAIPADKQGGLGWLNNLFGDAVTVRGDDGEEGGAAVILSRARTALDAGNLDQAVSTLEGLEGEPAAAMADWTQSANRRITLEAGLETLRLGMIGGEAQE